MSISDILVNNWLNNEIKFEPKIEDIYSQFKSGYYYGILLNKLQLISEEEFNLYIDSNELNIIEQNFILLENNLNISLGIKLKKEDIDDIIQNKKHKAILLLYKIKNYYYKYKIHFNDIKDTLIPMTQEEITQKVNLILDFDNEKNEDEKKSEIFFNNKVNIIKPKRIKIHKVTFSSLINNIEKEEIKDEKYYMKKKIILPKINKEHSIIKKYDSSIINMNENEEKKIIQKKFLIKNNSQINMLKYPHIPDEQKWKKIFHYKANNNRNKIELNKEISKNNHSFINIFQKKINLINSKTLNTSQINEASMPELNFVKKDKQVFDNIINKLSNKRNAYYYLEKNFVLVNVAENSKYKSAFKRKEYSDIFKRENEKNIVIKRINHFNKLFLNNEKIRKLKKSNLSASTDIINEGIKINKFDSESYLKQVDNLDIQEFKKYCEKRHKIYKKNFMMMKELFILMLKMAFEGYLYQQETKKNLIDIPFYLKLVKLFLKNKSIRRKTVIDEFQQIKEVSKINEIFDINKIELSKDELDFFNDYLFYTGFWNKERIIDTEILGKKIDYKLLFNDSDDYEPTEIENDDITLPKKLISNSDFGGFISEYIESKFSSMDNTIIKNSDKASKWFYIPYKLSLLGPAFIGNKYIGQQINNKYPNLKIYSVYKLLINYCTLYKKLSGPEEKTKKGKTKKNVSVEDKKKQLEEFEPIFNIIKPYLEQIDKDSNNIIPEDDILFKLLKFQIEKDFPKKTKSEMAVEMEEYFKKIINLKDKLEELKNNPEEKEIKMDEKEKNKEKEKSKKKSKKDKSEKDLQNIEKELENTKIDSIKGFILIDFPNNINQCYLLENYLTGYEHETQKPKSLKNKELKILSNIMDIKYEPKREKKLKNPGIDFILNFSSKEEKINTLFKNIKYDPIEDKIYSSLDLNESKDKKIIDRLTDKIPYFSNELAEFYRKEYEANFTKIFLFYNKLGFYPYKNNAPYFSVGKKVKTDINKGITVYQSMVFSELNNQISTNIIKENKVEVKKKKLKKYLSIKSNKSNKEQKDKDTEKEKEKENEENNSSSSDIYQTMTQNMLFFISKKIEILYEMNKKYMNIIKNENGENRKVDIKRVKTKKITEEDKDKIIFNLKTNSTELISLILSLTETYNINIKKFIYLITQQRNDIYKRFNLIQKKFRDYLNRQTPKKNIIHEYVIKYNKLIEINPDLLRHENVKNEFLNDIEYININLWQIINVKKNESIAELNDIKSCGYIEVEMCKFFNNIKELIFSEITKYIDIINSLIEFYTRNFINDQFVNIRTSNMSAFSRFSKLKEELNKSLENNNLDINLITSDLISIEDILKKDDFIYGIDIENNKNINNIEQNEVNYKYYSYTKYTSSLNHKINLLTKNINKLFFNAIKVMMQQNQKIVPFIKLLSEFNSALKKKIPLKTKKTVVFANNINNNNNNEISPQNNQINKEKNVLSEEIFKNIITNEKNNFKYRLIFIKDFAIKYMVIISKTSLKIFNNSDDWIIKSVHKENEIQNEVINLLKNKLQNMEKIDEDLDIDTIEMDSFERIIEDTEKNDTKINDTVKIRPIDNTSVISNAMYNKVNVDFLINDNFFDIKLEQIHKNENKKNNENTKIKDNNNKQNIYDYINDIKDYNLILPKVSNNYVGNYMMSEKSNFEEEISMEEFYYDIDKLFYIYKEMTAFEEDKDIINYDIFFELFVKKYIVNDNEEKITNEYNGIANILKKLSIKQIKRLISFCKLNIEQKSEDKNIEYDDFIKMPEIFTFLCLIGVDILTSEREEQILKYFDDKFFNGKFVEKAEFMKYNFWFEKFFDYQKFKKPSDESDLKFIEKDIEMNIKDFLFELWKDENNNIDLKKMLEVLKMSNYITDFIEYNNKKYFDVIFLE